MINFVLTLRERRILIIFVLALFSALLLGEINTRIDTRDYADMSENYAENDIVNINSAGIEQLVTLSGIGPHKARTIIAFREDNGKFRALKDLLQVKGIGEVTIKRIAANISFE